MKARTRKKATRVSKVKKIVARAKRTVKGRIVSAYRFTRKHPRAVAEAIAAGIGSARAVIEREVAAAKSKSASTKRSAKRPIVRASAKGTVRVKV